MRGIGHPAGDQIDVGRKVIFGIFELDRAEGARGRPADHLVGRTHGPEQSGLDRFVDGDIAFHFKSVRIIQYLTVNDLFNTDLRVLHVVRDRINGRRPQRVRARGKSHRRDVRPRRAACLGELHLHVAHGAGARAGGGPFDILRRQYLQRRAGIIRVGHRDRAFDHEQAREAVNGRKGCIHDPDAGLLLQARRMVRDDVLVHRDVPLKRRGAPSDGRRDDIGVIAAVVFRIFDLHRGHGARDRPDDVVARLGPDQPLGRPSRRRHADQWTDLKRKRFIGSVAIIRIGNAEFAI